MDRRFLLAALLVLVLRCGITGEASVDADVQTPPSEGQPLVTTTQAPPTHAGEASVDAGVQTSPSQDQPLAATTQASPTHAADSKHGAMPARRYVRTSRYRHKRGPPPARAFLALFLMFAFMTAAQSGLFWWKQRHPHSFQEVTLVGLWLFPLALSLYRLWWRFLLFSFVFSLSTGWQIWLATRKPLGTKTPQRVYNWFIGAYRACYITGVVGYLLMLAEVIWARPLGEFGKHYLMPGGFLTLFYGMYFGVLGRDCAEVCAERMSNTIGYVKYDNPPPNLCGLCGDELRPSFVYKDDPNAPKPQRLFTLNCKHEFHEACIRGWTIVGKKDTCPFCTEKVNLKSVLSSSPLPWESQTTLWIQVLDALRYLIVWNPIILLGVHGMFWIFGLVDNNGHVPVVTPSPTFAG